MVLYYDSKCFILGGCNLENKSVTEIMKLYSDVLDELKKRNVIRTFNSPVGDYAEWLVCKVLELELVPNSKKGHDAVGPDGKRFQIKSRLERSGEKQRQLGVIRNFNNDEFDEFDELIAIIFDEDFSVKEAYKVKKPEISKYSVRNNYQNGHILHMKGQILEDTNVENITVRFRE